MNIESISIGGWFQRTTLHLSEIYNFLRTRESPLDLDHKKLKSLHEGLSIDSIEFDVANLEFIKFLTREGIEVKIFEDGLIFIKNSKASDLKKDISKLTFYYEKKLSPAISYIFSLGAPVPKELANIKNIYPYFVVLDSASETNVNQLLTEFKQEESFEIKEPSFEVYRGEELYIVNNLSEEPEVLEKFVQEQIFIREFKGQLHRYLNLHRIIWERIAEVKERGKIKGKEVEELNTRIESYAKTINLIEARINQMGTYLSTRASIFKSDEDMKRFVKVLSFKHETLGDTLSYIKEIWKMTKNYVDSALKLFASIQAQSTESSVKNLTIVTSMGVGATLIGLFAQRAPEFTLFGISYFFILAAVGYLADKIMRQIALKRKYEINEVEIAKDIK